MGDTAGMAFPADDDDDDDGDDDNDGDDDDDDDVDDDDDNDGDDDDDRSPTQIINFFGIYLLRQHPNTKEMAEKSANDDDGDFPLQSLYA